MGTRPEYNSRLCIWKDLYYLHREGHKTATSFEGYDEWEDEHPLHKCLGCEGYDNECKGYKSLKKFNIR